MHNDGQGVTIAHTAGSIPAPSTMKDNMSNWDNYKESVQSLRDKIAGLQSDYYRLLETCTCEEREQKTNYGPGSRFNKPTKTIWDQCVVCMRMFNVKTMVNGGFKERRTK